MSERTCSVFGCGEAARSKGLCSKHYQREWQRSAKVRERSCSHCGAFPVISRAALSRNVFCGPVCSSAFELAKRRAATKRKMIPRPCEFCGREFVPEKVSTQRFCSRACTNGAAIARKAISGDTCSEGDCTRPVHAKGLCNRHYMRVRWAEKKRQEGRVFRDCEHCGSTFEARTRGKRFCSERCSRRSRYLREKANPTRLCEVDGCERPHWAKGLCLVHYRHKFFPASGNQSGHWILPEDRQAIYERDNYSCYICGLEVFTDVDMGRDDRAATLDHVVPRREGGSDEPENLRTCCRLCNSRKTFLGYSEEQGELALTP